MRHHLLTLKEQKEFFNRGAEGVKDMSNVGAAPLPHLQYTVRSNEALSMITLLSRRGPFAIHRVCTVSSYPGAVPSLSR